MMFRIKPPKRANMSIFQSDCDLIRLFRPLRLRDLPDYQDLEPPFR